MNLFGKILRYVGSLWLAALLLLLLLVSMACATVYESTHDSARALAVFYHAWWFEALLGLLCVNILFSFLTRLNSWRRQLGYLTTHAAVLMVFGGAWITQLYGVDGHVQLAEGQTTDAFFISTETLKVIRPENRLENEIVLASDAFRGFEPAEKPEAPVLTLGDARFTIERYLPDSDWQSDVVECNDLDQPSAVEVSLNSGESEDTVWIFEQRGGTPKDATVVYKRYNNPAALEKALAPPAETQPSDSKGNIKVTVEGKEFVFPLEDCLEKVTAIGDTKYQFQVLRYLPHAAVGDNRKLENASDQPVNPAIEIELRSGDVSVRRVAFARFPGFMHGQDDLSDVQLVLETSDIREQHAPLEILGGPNDVFYARFEMGSEPVKSVKVNLGTPAETPWEGWQIAIRRYFEHARKEGRAEPVADVRANREPALLVRVDSPQGAEQIWLRKYEPHDVSAAGMALGLLYADRKTPLGFGLRLNKLTIGRYPGENMPRSYESQITTIDPLTGREQSHVISMNHPVKFGGFKFFQSAVNQDERAGRSSVLGVSRDPGQLIVFGGYLLLMAGLILVLLTRMLERRAVPASVGGLSTSSGA